MILGMGLDLVDISDFERTLNRGGEAYLERVYTPGEIAYCRAQPHRVQSLAVRFAAKEAAMKALDIADQETLNWTDIEVVSSPSGRPNLVLHGVAREKANALGVRRIIVSLSHSLSAVGAVVVADGTLKTSMSEKHSIGQSGC